MTTLVFLLIIALSIAGYFIWKCGFLERDIQSAEKQIKLLENSHKQQLYEVKNEISQQYHEQYLKDRERLKDNMEAFRNIADPIIAQKAKYYGLTESELSDTFQTIFAYDLIYTYDEIDKTKKDILEKELFDFDFVQALAIYISLTIKAVDNTLGIPVDYSKEDRLDFSFAVKMFCTYFLHIKVTNSDIANICNSAYNNCFNSKTNTFVLQDEFRSTNSDVIYNLVKIIATYWLSKTFKLELDDAANITLSSQKLFSGISESIHYACVGNTYLRSYARIKSIIIKKTQRLKKK